MKILTSTIISLLLLNSLVFSQDSIGFSFNSDRDNTPFDENTVAGVVPSLGWVSTDGGVDAQGGANGNIEYKGVTVEWSSNGTWNTNNGVDSGDNQVMNGYIDAVGGGDMPTQPFPALKRSPLERATIYMYILAVTVMVELEKLLFKTVKLILILPSLSKVVDFPGHT